MTDYNPWPCGRRPEFDRPELAQVKAAGYDWIDPRDIIGAFERRVAKFAGAKYGVAVDCASHGLFLSLKCAEPISHTVTIPSHTYMSVPMQIIHSGHEVEFEDIEWSGAYQLKPYPIWDAATRWRAGMYIGGFHIVSFQMKKRVPIGRGGMILLDNKDDYEYLKKLRYDGRDLDKDYMEDVPHYLGYHYYMTPEDAARGLLLMDRIPWDCPDSGGSENYSDLSQMEIFK